MSVLPPDPWPGTAGGAWSPNWGPNIRLYVWAAIAAGTTMHWGPDPTGRYDAGNVYGGTSPAPPGGTGGLLWRDITCDVLDLQTSLGADSADGPITKANAGTATFTLRDTHRDYDPLNPASPYQYAGVSRLGPGTAVKIWAELYSPAGGSDLTTEAGDQLVTEAGDQLNLEAPFPSASLTPFMLHTGTVDSWEAPWEPNPQNRRANVVSSDATKDLVALDRGEQPAAGAGDTTNQRIERILTYYGWTGTRVLDPSAVTLQATTFAQSAWELIGRVSDDEIGLTYIDPSGVLRFRTRALWQTVPAPALTVGCSPQAPSAWDIILDANVAASGAYYVNAAYATRTGGTQQTAKNLESIQLYKERGLKRTDLGLNTDPQVATWASFLVSLLAWPRARITDVALRPALDHLSWADVLGIDLMTERVQVYWKPPDSADTVTGTGRAIGVDHNITFRRWDVGLHLALGDLQGRTLHWGPHPNDHLDAGYSYS